MSGNSTKERTSEYRGLLELCEKYRLEDYADRLREDTENAEEIAEKLGEFLRSHVEFYYRNKQIYDGVRTYFEENIVHNHGEITAELEKKLRRKIRDLGRDQALTVLWLKSGNNLSVYGELLSFQIRESGAKEYCDDLLFEYRALLRNLVHSATERVTWVEASAPQVERAGDIVWEEDETGREEIHLADDFVFRLMQAANNIGFGNSIRLLSGAELLQKAIEIGRNAITLYLERCMEQYLGLMTEARDSYRDSFLAALLESFVDQTEIRPEDTADRVFEMETDLTKQELYGDVSFYPVMRGQSLKFLQTRCYRQMIAEEDLSVPVSEWAGRIVFAPYFEECMSKSKAQMFSSIYAYSGTRLVRMPLIYVGAERFTENKELVRHCPFFEKMDWEPYRELLQEDYHRRQEELRSWQGRFWGNLCKEKEKQLVDQNVQYMQAIFEKELDAFIAQWQTHLASVMEQAAARGAYQLPPEQDFYVYYQWYYYPEHPTEYTVGYLMEYRQRGRISDYIVRQISLLDTGGKSLRPKVQAQIGSLFDSYLRQLEDARGRVFYQRQMLPPPYMG